MNKQGLSFTTAQIMCHRENEEEKETNFPDFSTVSSLFSYYKGAGNLLSEGPTFLLGRKYFKIRDFQEIFLSVYLYFSGSGIQDL